MPSIIVVGSDGDSEEYIRTFVSANSITGYNTVELSEKVKIDDIKTIIKTFTIKTSRQQKRLIILPEIITLPAQNSLLKFLEELEDLDYVIFKVKSVDTLLPTIRSRSKIVFLTTHDIQIDPFYFQKIKSEFQSGVSAHGLLSLSQLIDSTDDYSALVIALRQYVLMNNQITRNKTVQYSLFSLLRYLHINFQLVTENNLSSKATIEAY